MKTNQRDIIEAIETAVQSVDQRGLAQVEMINNLSILLRKSGKYDEFDNHCIHTVVDFGKAWTIEILAHSLVKRAIDVGAETALREVLSYQTDNYLRLKRVLLLQNIRIDKAYDFSNGVSLIDIQDLPTSQLRDSLISQRWGSCLGWNVHAVLLTDLTVKKKIRAQGEKCGSDRSALEELSAKTRLLDDTRLLLSLARPFEFGVSALAATTLVPARTSFIDDGPGYETFPEAYIGPNPPVIRFEAQLSDKMLLAYSAFSEETKVRFRTALKRLNDAKIDPNWANKAINLRICLENMCLNPGERKEIKKAIKKRAPEITDFSKTRAEKVYEFLSNAVHSGKAQHHPEINVSMITSEIHKAMRQILDDGRYPAWPELSSDWTS